MDEDYLLVAKKVKFVSMMFFSKAFNYKSIFE
jgi:hypothetical protein